MHGNAAGGGRARGNGIQNGSGGFFHTSRQGMKGGDMDFAEALEASAESGRRGLAAEASWMEGIVAGSTDK